METNDEAQKRIEETDKAIEEKYLKPPKALRQTKSMQNGSRLTWKARSGQSRDFSISRSQRIRRISMTKSNKNDSSFGAIFIAMPMSVMTAVSGNIVYSSGIATGSSFVVVFGAFLEIIGFLGIAVSIYIAVKDQKDLKNKEND